MTDAERRQIGFSMPCPSCKEFAYVIADGRAQVTPEGIKFRGRFTEVRHATPTGSNNCAGIA